MKGVNTGSLNYYLKMMNVFSKSSSETTVDRILNDSSLLISIIRKEANEDICCIPLTVDSIFFKVMTHCFQI